MKMDSKFKFTEDYIVIDTETTIRNVGDDAVGKNKASAFHPDNRIVAMGGLYKDLKYNFEHEDSTVSDIALFQLEKEGVTFIPKLWIGQNIKFDMHHLFKASEDFQYEIFPHIQIWDTQLAEYLLTGQEHQYAGLNELSKKYGGTQKNDVIKAMWDEGIQTEDIDSELLLPYLKDDVLNTHLVFDKQLQEADRLNMIPLILTQMDALKCTIEMEYNGMHFNRNKALSIADEIDTDLELTYNKLALLVRDMGISNLNFNPSSTKHVGIILFGGDIKIQDKENVLNNDGTPYRYKTGKRKGEIKTKNICKTVKINGCEIPILNKWVTDKGGTSVSDSVLNDISKSIGSTGKTKKFITLVQEHRTLTKQRSTYFVGYSTLTWPTDSCIHQGLNHTSTATGRLSSSKPNLQNVTNKGD